MMAYASWSVVFGEQPSAAKWNILGSNDASFNDGTGFNDSIVLPKHLFTGTGTSWATQSWTPTWTNLTIGNGTNASTYIQIGKIVVCYLAFTLGSTSSVGASAFLTLPVTSKSTILVDAALGLLAMGAYQGSISWRSTTTAQLKAPAPSGNGVLNQGTSSTVPFTWTTGSTIGGYFMYEAA